MSILARVRLKDPVRKLWVVQLVQFGMVACLAVVPLALIAGPIRGIPWWWQLIDMSLGVFGIIPLLLAHANVRKLAAQPAAGATPVLTPTSGAAP